MVNGKCENAKTLTQRRSSCKINGNVAAAVAATASLGHGKAPLDQRKLSTLTHSHTHTLIHWQTCHQLAKRGGPANRIEEEQAADAPRVALLLLQIEINLDIGTLLTSINSNCW